MTPKFDPMGKDGMREMPTGRPGEPDHREAPRPDPKKRPTR